MALRRKMRPLSIFGGAPVDSRHGLTGELTAEARDFS